MGDMRLWYEDEKVMKRKKNLKGYKSSKTDLHNMTKGHQEKLAIKDTYITDIYTLYSRSLKYFFLFALSIYYLQ